MLSENQTAHNPLLFTLGLDRTSQLESWSFRLERSVESLCSKMNEMFSKLATSIVQVQETQVLSNNSLASLHKRMDTMDTRLTALEQTQQNLHTEMRAIDKKLDQLISLFNQKGV